MCRSKCNSRENGGGRLVGNVVPKVFTTDQCDNDAKCYSLSQEVNKLKEKLTSGYVPESYGFPGNYYKFKSGNFRIILTRKDEVVNNNTIRIYVILCILKHDHKYERFHQRNTPENERDSITGKASLVWDKYRNLVEDEFNKPQTVILKPELSDAENCFISTQMCINHSLFDWTIYETKNWIKDVQEVGFNDYSNAASEIEKFIEGNLYETEGWNIIKFKEKAILIYHQGNNWILDRIVERNEKDNYISLTNQDPPVDYQRGYPYDFLADKDIWRIMEQDKKSNMVLSQQQVEIVSNIKKEFPLFLTGRAGSGKSTILQYLFAEIVLNYLNTIKKYETGLKRPVYLSYSSNLIDDARKLCKTLFEKNNVYKTELEKYDIQYKQDIEPILNKIFFVFTDLLRICIDDHNPCESDKRFPQSDYMSFPKFNTEWNKKFGKIRDAARKYGPSISWHVIRTYIKGWYNDKYMTPEEYEQIGEKNQTVSLETYRVIFDQVWTNWYSKIEDRWDDQDIVRYCLEHNIIDERFSAVFCDEAQDFTRIEIDLIIKLSSFSNRNLQNVGDIKKLSFVFAGDEFQTLNPTGFSWASLSSYFTESLCNSTGLHQFINELRTPDTIELSENYRSTKQVVKLANRIQLLRATRFKEYSKPQTPHFSENGSSIYCVSPSNKQTIQKLKDKKVILIVPAADGESIEEYIQKSALKGQIQFDEGVPQDMTILNPTQAKGLEYPNVAVYGFSNTEQIEPLRLDNLLSWFEKHEENAVSDIELKYQISNAYVAATRAVANLYILDDFNDRSFWAFAFNHENPEIDTKVRDLQKCMFKQLSDGQKDCWSEDELGWIEIKPDGIDITDENISYLTSEEHKYDLENKAEANHDVGMLRQAACLHKSTGNKKDEARCKAKAFHFEEDYLNAAEWFEKAEDFEAAVDNYWFLMNEKLDCSIISKIANLKDYSQNLKVRICLKCDNPTVNDLKVSINETIEMLSHNQEEHSVTDAWQYVLGYMLNRIKPKKKDGIHDIPVIVKNRHKLSDLGIDLNLPKLASLAYNIGATKDAITLWEELSNNDRPKEYYQAKIDTLKYPETMEFYEGTGNPNWMIDLLHIYRKKTNSKLNDSQRKIISRVIRVKGDKDEFLEFLPYLLRISTSLEQSHNVLEDADKFGCELNMTVLKALIETRFTNLSTWNAPKQKFISPDASFIFDAIAEIKRMRKEDFKGYMTRSLQAMKIIDFGKQYNRYSRKKDVSKLIFLELGRAFEARDIFIDAIRYYEWARNQADDTSYKRAIDIRWIACKERQAEYEKDSYKNEAYKKEALTKRQELGLSSEEKLPEIPSLTPEDWENIFSFYVNVSNEQIEEKKIRNKKVKEEPLEMNTLRNFSKQELRYGDYAIVFFPNKQELVLKDTVNEYNIRIKQGLFPDNGDFFVKENHIYVSDNNSKTPFVYENKEKELILKVFEDDAYTGISVTVDLN